MKKFLLFILIGVFALTAFACNEKDNGDNLEGDTILPATENAEEANENADSETEKNVKSDGYNKFSQLEIGMTESEVNAVLGEPTSVDKAYYYYNIVVNGCDLELTVWINTTSGLVTYIQGNFYKDDYRAEFADSATDLSQVNGLESGEIDTYEACVNAFKTAGYLISVNESGETRYLWVNADDGYMTITFTADGDVKTFSGYC